MKAHYLAALVLGRVCCNGLCMYRLIPFRGIFSEKIGHLLSVALFNTRIKSQKPSTCFNTCERIKTRIWGVGFPVALLSSFNSVPQSLQMFNILRQCCLQPISLCLATGNRHLYSWAAVTSPLLHFSLSAEVFLLMSPWKAAWNSHLQLVAGS